MEPFTLSWVIGSEDDGKLVREFLKAKDISKIALTDIKFNGGKIVVNSQEVTVRTILKVDDVVKVIFPIEHPSEEMVEENLPLSIVFEDDYLLIINKQAFMPTIPSREHPRGSLANALLHYYKKQGIGSTIHIVNRLDRDTTGLLIVAKHRYTHHLFSKQQKATLIRRTYEAIVEGELKEDVGNINAPIGRKDTSIIEREVREDGQEAITQYEVLNRFKGFTHVSLTLQTGRTHQIRVHMSHIGHPLLGDELYGGGKELIFRQALHSRTLTFTHPITSQPLSFSASLPEDMQQVLRSVVE
ncbi:23S rRNA pseudouridine1911/1915/1917 synthase [Bacillus mesophilus]|uniref:Pseudouridine synthase n=1 Tax=Bacillus mesophilus TaxID=1808955 RepID=A0A6M0Q648_9BACI|nr:RluA family pseudouridine synthase [Bacillus mesophilus]MBM7659735.1 23S rRNA pseudouridine1911/1915/1917 synthase [Bacillus mesophilus]NEY70598.1 RluA family pseudouridine synthase [Bacillus mesophilus]